MLTINPHRPVSANGRYSNEKYVSYGSDAAPNSKNHEGNLTRFPSYQICEGGRTTMPGRDVSHVTPRERLIVCQL